MESKKLQFHDFVAVGNVLCGLKSRESFGAISELSSVLCSNNAGLDSSEIASLVIEREKLFPTVIAPGLAVPRARIEEINSPLVAIGTSREGIDFKDGGAPVKIVIFVLTPKSDPSIHLQLLSALARDFSDTALFEKMSQSRSPSELLEAFGSHSLEKIPDYLTARDIMRKNGLLTLSESNTLSDAIRIFATQGIFDIPIVDEDKDIRGMISMEDVMRLSLPEHLLWMDDLSPILRFQPFAELLKNEKETKITDIMREDFVSVDVSVPAVQVAKIFIVKKVRLIIVTESGKLAGTVRLQEFIRKFFWE
ncbi:MAG TPA: PTS sugar transporter subunit IIA [Victivallales bacterium]|nr:PTS sugar transporter subunit IIA [Victivallales bacterium]